MQKDKYVFTGDAWEFFFISLGLIILSAITFGIAFPFYIYWMVRYFITHTELHASE